MEVLDQKELEALKKYRAKKPCISIYIPTVKKGDVNQNSIRFKNMLNNAEEQLLEKNYRKNEINALLEPAFKLINESIFWNNQSDGLALFVSPEFYKYYRLPIGFEEMVVVTNYFYTKPLLPVISEDGQFYILALSQKDARLFRASRDSIEEMDLSDIIQKFEEKFAEDFKSQYLQFHTRAPRRGEIRAAVYFGHGGDISSIKKEKLMRYFRFLDKELHSMLYHDGSPLILACVDFLAPFYKKANNYSGLLNERIKGNPENMKTEELHSRAWEIVSPYLERKKEECITRYRKLKGTGKTSNDIEEVIKAAFHGRVETLFVPNGIQRWGKYDRKDNKIKIKASPEPGDEDLLDLAATETFLNRGEVYVEPPGSIPEGDFIAAIFRY